MPDALGRTRINTHVAGLLYRYANLVRRKDPQTNKNKPKKRRKKTHTSYRDKVFHLVELLKAQTNMVVPYEP